MGFGKFTIADLRLRIGSTGEFQAIALNLLILFKNAFTHSNMTTYFLAQGVFGVKIENFHPKNTPKRGKREKKFHFFSLFPHPPK
jgi:hypothetical protein